MVVGEISQERNLVIIGGGPGGYTAAIRAAQLGQSVTIIEQEKLGGVCLNEGCIPSKIFTNAASKRIELKQLQQMGIGDGESTFSLQQLHKYKNTVIDSLRAGIEKLCKENKVELLRGKATFVANNRIGVENGHQFDIYEFKQAIIATGSIPVIPSVFENNKGRILFANTIFNLQEIPEHLVVIGNDYICLEVASSFAAFGSKITIILGDNGDFQFDDTITKELKRVLKKRKIDVIKGNAKAIDERIDGLSLTIEMENYNVKTIDCSYLFVQTERKPNVDQLGIDRFGIIYTEEGFIKTDQHMQTSIPMVYAIGDVTEGPLLAVKAIKQGKAAVEAIAGQKPEIDTTFLPKIVHTNPPIASVGLTEREAATYKIPIRVSSFPLVGSGYAAITGKRDGIIKVISDSTNDLIVGIHMIGDSAVEMSSFFVQLLEMAAKEEDIKFPLYPHPSYNEGLLEAVEGLIGQAIHTMPEKKKVPSHL